MAHCSRIDFRPVNGYWFTSHLIRQVRGREDCFEATLDIGLSRREICVHNNILKFDGYELNIEEVEPSEEDRVVVFEKETLRAYEVVLHLEDGFYKLKAVGMDKAPTLEINGIHMHRIHGIDPWMDTLRKIKAVKIKSGNRVLDTCMGLGYTSIVSSMRGAAEILTFEIDENVIWIAERNPWSSKLRSNEIKITHGDVTECIHDLPDEYFDRIVHDPPRFTRHTGNLYSLEFYMELYRVLKPGGLLFHYTGEPRRHGGVNILGGVRARLEKAGLKIIGYDRVAQGYIAVKLF